MAYERTNWQNGDVISSEKLNKMEKGIEAACNLEHNVEDPKEGQILKYSAAKEKFVNADLPEITPVDGNYENFAPVDDGTTASIQHNSNTLFMRGGKLCIAYKYIAVGDELVEGDNYGDISLADFYVEDEVLDHQTPIILQAGAETTKTLTTRLETLDSWSYWGYNPDILTVVSHDATSITIKPKSKTGTCVIGTHGKFKGTDRMHERWVVVVCD